jgi:hypothetical protein
MRKYRPGVEHTKVGEESCVSGSGFDELGDENPASCKFETNPLAIARVRNEIAFRETSGSLIKTHSFPREVHFEQGCCRSHLTFDSAQAYVQHSVSGIDFGDSRTYPTGSLSRFV